MNRLLSFVSSQLSPTRFPYAKQKPKRHCYDHEGVLTKRRPFFSGHHVKRREERKRKKETNQIMSSPPGCQEGEGESVLDEGVW